MRRRTITLEQPASRVRRRAIGDVHTREAHLMPSVREPDGKVGAVSRPKPDGRARAPLAGEQGEQTVAGELPVSPESLQMLIAHLIGDPATARQMAVSPARALRKLTYLSDRERKHLWSVDDEILRKLADASSRYASGAKEVGYGGAQIPLGPSGGPLGRGLDAIKGLGREGGYGGRGGRGGGGYGLEGIDRFLPPSRGGLSRGQWSGLGIPGGGAGGGSRGGSSGGRGYGGLSRGWWSGSGIPGTGSLGSKGIPDVGPGGDEGAPDIGVIPGTGRRAFGGDPLITARAWGVLNPGGAVSDDPDSGKDDAGKDGGTKGTSGGEEPRGSSNQKLSEDAARHPLTPPDQTERTAPHSVWRDVAIAGGGGAVVGAVVGASLDPIAPLGPAIAGAVIGGIVGGLGGAGYHYVQHDLLHKYYPADDGSGVGPGGPRARYSSASMANSFMPADDGSGPTGPRSRGTSEAQRFRLRDDLMPAPDDPGGGGPWSNVFIPNPETGDPGNPHSRAASALADLVAGVSSLGLATSSAAR